ncbi:sensor histidine kinase [Dyadobacter arcticus]|uniref:histidine kinase n=1 Tax=Dyadobacter arcticus TaxID=1078754 RepID=A0ABX0UPQ9_9BACT|nr:ATP-binding protein [Dyadobacter arcticus]NIJ53949.1 signal transduction histidine kinase/ligand-binding sensor domain-containing protein [Dyadobacter arcticus]
MGLKVRRFGSFLLLLSMLAGLSPGWAQRLRRSDVIAAEPEVGRPMASMFQSSEYHAHDQNFAITQDKSGVMYFANFAGVLEYDGVSWNTIQTENVTRVSALVTDSKNRVLVGANGEFGYLKYDSLGVHRFVSLSSGLKEKPTQVIRIVPVAGGAWFVTDRTNFFWNGRSVKISRHDLRIQSAFPYKNRIIVYARNKGMLAMDNGQVSKIEQNADVPVLLDLAAVVPLNGNSALLLTTSQGAFRLRNNRIEAVSGNANPTLIRDKVTAAVRMEDGRVAISTAFGGILIMTDSGDIYYPVDPDSSIGDSQVSAMFNDRDHNLWLALNDGIARFDLSSPISVFDAAGGLKGAVTSIMRFQGRLMVGTLYGLYYIENNRVIRVRNFPGSCLGFDEAGGRLYISSNKGLFEWTNNGALTNVTNDFSLSVTASQSGTELYVGLEDGLAVFRKSGNSWIPGRFKNVNEQIVGATEFPAGTLWLETLSDGILKLDPSTGAVKRFSEAQGILSPLYNKLAFYDKKLIASNKDGLFEYQPQTDRFLRADWLHGEKAWFDRIREDNKGNIWTTRGDKKSATFFRKRATTGFDVIETPLLPIAEIPFGVIYPDENGSTWLGGDQGLYRLDMQIPQQYVYKYPVLLRSIATQKGMIPFNPDSVITDAVTLPYKQNNVIFEFALPSFHSNQVTEYQYLLENYDSGWSDWGPLSRKEYNGLPSGKYVFKVRARDVYKNVLQEAVFPLTILTPWYRHWFMIALYVLTFAVIIYFLVRWRLRRIIREKRQLETMILERTEEVVNQKEELEHQSEELSATNDQLERIDEFVKAINGEVNTQKLFQLVLDRLCEFQNVDGASALIYNKSTDNYQFIALAGAVKNANVEDVRLTAKQARQRYADRGEEVYEDIFLKNNFRAQNVNDSIDEVFTPRSLITILIRVEGDVKSYITLENMDRENAFRDRDFTMVKNLKEHLIGAYIKTNILEDLENTLSNLKSTQEELIRQERLASVGSLTKGIVDRILNPLNYINNFSQSSGKLLKEITEVTDKHQDGLSEDEKDDLDSGFDMLHKNLEKIYEHGNSTTRIVKDMQKLLKGKSTEFFVTDLNPFLESKSKSAIQEVLNEYKDAKVKLSFALDTNPVKVSLLPYEFTQVLTNVISNACYALAEKAKLDKAFEPEVIVSTKPLDGNICIRIKDNGKGIALKETEQLFNPFFTTKPTSKGTGLGLYMSKDIIEFHKGRMLVNSKEGEFTEVDIILPVVK